MKLYSSVIEHIARNSQITPDRICMADGRGALTYSEVWSRIYGFSQNLRELGLTSGSCAAVECTQNTDYMISEFAVQLAGGIFVPIEKNAAAGRLSEILRDTGAVLYIGKDSAKLAAAGFAEPADGAGAAIKSETAASDGAGTPGFVSIQTAADFACPAEKIPPVEEITFPDAEQVAEILFSTGTTGKSKGIVLTHGNDMAIAENVMCGVKMKKDNVELVPMPLSHSHGLRRTYANMVNGSTAVFSDGVTLLKKVFTLMDEYGVTAIDLSPSMLSIIFKLSKDRLGDYADVLDYIQLGSAPLSEEDKVHLSRILPDTRLYNFYGSTEAGCSCLLDFNSMSGRPGCIGKPAVNAHFIVVDENRNEIDSSPENTGFLASSGAINMKGYFLEPELTAETMQNGYIYTKDLGYIDPDGYIYMLGRKDDVINYGGIKISPEEIESIVVQHPAVKDCACVPVSDALTGQAPKLFVALSGNAGGSSGSTAAADANEAHSDSSAGSDNSTAFNLKEFKAFLASHLDANKQPKYIETIDEIPRTFNGKIRRNLLTDLDKK